LILAGVTINLVINGGLIQQAQNAKTATQDAVVYEQIQLAAAEAQIEKTSDSSKDIETIWGNIANSGNYKDAVTSAPSAATYVTIDGVPIPKGFEYLTGTKNTGLEIKNSIDGNEFVWVSCTMDGTNGTVKYEKWTSSVNGGSSTAETSSDDTLPNGIDDETSQISTYGGFYIARYSAGLPGNLGGSALTIADAADRDKSSYAPISKKDNIPWNYITYNKAKSNAEIMYSNDFVQSGLVTGTQWDSLMKWLENSGYDVQINSEKWGNYYNSDVTGIKEYSSDDGATWISADLKPSGTEGLLKTGDSDYTKASNIYDLAGNLYEWTSEVSTGTSHNRRGGCNLQSVLVYPAASRSSQSIGYSGGVTGFRVVIYIK